MQPTHTLKYEIIRDAEITRVGRKTARDLRGRADALKKKARKMVKEDPANKPKAEGLRSKAYWMREMARTGLNKANTERQDRRLRHLAYAFLRNRRYDQCERVTSPDKGLDSYAIKAIAKLAGADEAMIRYWVQNTDTCRKDLEEGITIRKNIQLAQAKVLSKKADRDRADRDYLAADQEVGRAEKSLTWAKDRKRQALDRGNAAALEHEAAQKEVAALEKELADFMAKKEVEATKAMESRFTGLNLNFAKAA